MNAIHRRQFLKIAGLGAVSILSESHADGANFIAKKFLSLPPRKTPFVTPNNDFYIVQCCGFPKIDLANWSVTITGMVEKPLRLTHAELLQIPSIEKMVTLQCIDNEVVGELISNAVWKGVSLADLLKKTNPSPLVTDVVFHGADDYSDSITLDRAMNYDVFLAYQMNGAILPKEHGFPLRAIVPGIYGIKNVKWLTKIELVSHDYKGYWQKKGWTDEGTIKVKSRIDAPGPYNTIKGDYTLRGIAFSGHGGIGSVEVTLDGGKKWSPAQLEPTPSPYSWVFWKYYLKKPARGAYQVAVLAIDKMGNRQTDFVARPFPDGTSGLHSIVTFVE